MSLSPSASETDPRVLIPALCRHFYTLGWVTGTGGGMSIKKEYVRPCCDCWYVFAFLSVESNATSCHSGLVYIAPSGVQKESIEADDLFVLDETGAELSGPPEHRGLKKSQCTPLFMAAYRMRGAGACIHSHSTNAVIATLLCGSELKVTHLEMIKGIRNDSTGAMLRFDDTLVVPVIENTAFECDLTQSLEAALAAYPDTCAVLVRRHGVYVFGPTWQAAKAMAECYDYLFELYVKMRQIGLDPAAKP